MKKFLAALATLALALGLVVVAAAGPASAHTPTVTPSCTGLYVKAVSYETQQNNATPNNIKVTVDGSQVANANFGATFGAVTYPFTPSSTSHSYKVVIDAVGTDYDKTWTGNSVPCVTPKDPTFDPSSCAGPGQPATGFYTITATPGVKYQSELDGAAYKDVSAGKYPIAQGSTVYVKALPDGSTLSGTTSWSYKALATGDCKEKAIPAEPTIKVASTCTVPGSITVGTETGVLYTFVTGSATMTSGAYEVTATPKAGYYFDGAQSVTYKGTLGTLTDCGSVKTTPVAVAQSCTTTGVSTPVGASVAAAAASTAPSATSVYVPGNITVTAASHVTYTIHRVDGTTKDVTSTGGTITLTPGDYIVTASATGGWTMTGQTVFPLTINSAVLCTQLIDHALVSGAASATDQACTTNGLQSGYIAVQQDPDLAYQVGTTALTAARTNAVPGTYTVTAVVTDPGDTYDGTPSWTVTIHAASGVCGDLTTLAFTGGAWGMAYLSLASLLLLAGGFVVIRSRTVRRKAA